MLTDKQVKKKFKLEASQNPEKFYATNYLEKEGFLRNQCEKCGTYFWSTDKNRKVCGDPTCSGGFSVVSNNPAKNKLSYIDVWKTLSDFFQKRNYKPIQRYPVVARWNPTADFVMASIAAFQPYVITGEVEPPAKKLVIPQFSLRFGDVDNVGITGSHLTGFVMIGQHQFLSAEEWSQEQAFKDIYEYIIQVVGLSKDELTLHEDAWAGGGSYGSCMEFFSRGVELFNQVYTLFEQTPNGDRPLKLKVLDMGLGMERIAWFSQGTPNIYEATFPNVLSEIRKRVDVKPDFEFFNRFSKFSSYLNVDETDNIDLAWNNVAQKLGVSLEELKTTIRPMTAVYSIAEHMRTLLVAITDGALPSNVGGGYNLRSILRRAQSFVDEFNWDLKLSDVCLWHAAELKELFPELSEKLDSVTKIIDVEVDKFRQSRKKAHGILRRELEKGITKEKMLELYDSNGITPQMILLEARAMNFDVQIPDDFYKLVSEIHEKREQIHSTYDEDSFDLDPSIKTELIYFDDWKLVDFETEILEIISLESNKGILILKESAFYPTSGGQLHDLGTINSVSVYEVRKSGSNILHKVEDVTGFKKGQKVKCKVDFERRKQLTQNHTATHIVNAGARSVLGDHINQAGAKKTPEKAHLDVTHYQSLSDFEINEIEKYCNEIISKKIPIHKTFMSRNDAEKKYGMRIYQGGAVPGNKIRIVDIENIDVEACGGTHLNNTSEVDVLKILKSTKVQDGIVRIEFVSGKKAQELENQSQLLVSEIEELLAVSKEKLISRVEQIFSKWKKAKKLKKKNKLEEMDWEYVGSDSENLSDEEIVAEISNQIKTQPQHIISTLKRFLEELEAMKK